MTLPLVALIFITSLAILLWSRTPILWLADGTPRIFLSILLLDCVVSEGTRVYLALLYSLAA